jgi:hypothetical protein
MFKLIGANTNTSTNANNNNSSSSNNNANSNISNATPSVGPDDHFDAVRAALRLESDPLVQMTAFGGKLIL